MSCCHDHDHSYYSTGLSADERDAIDEAKETARQLAHVMKTLGIERLPKPKPKPIPTLADALKAHYSATLMDELAFKEPK